GLDRAAVGPEPLDDLPRLLPGGEEGRLGAARADQEPVSERQPVPRDLLPVCAADSTAAIDRAALERVGVRHQPAGWPDARAEAARSPQGRHSPDRGHHRWRANGLLGARPLDAGLLLPAHTTHAAADAA